MKLGFIGLGAMSKPMAKRLMAARHDLFVYDVAKKAVEELVENGAVKCLSPCEAAEKSQLTLLSLPNSAIVIRVVSSVEGVLAGAAEGHTIIDLSSLNQLAAGLEFHNLFGRNLDSLSCLRITAFSSRPFAY
jgi:3-hydroxyisobutyrate dehydrogenase-like beta-hydroxyacid dehydrogenase